MTDKPQATHDEAMGYTITMCGSLTERELYVAETAIKAARRWTLREIKEDLKDKIHAA